MLPPWRKFLLYRPFLPIGYRHSLVHTHNPPTFFVETTLQNSPAKNMPRCSGYSQRPENGKYIQSVHHFAHYPINLHLNLSVCVHIISIEKFVLIYLLVLVIHLLWNSLLQVFIMSYCYSTSYTYMMDRIYPHTNNPYFFSRRK